MQRLFYRFPASVGLLVVALSSVIACGPELDEGIKEYQREETAVGSAKQSVSQVYDAMAQGDWEEVNDLTCQKKKLANPVPDPGFAQKMSTLVVSRVLINSLNLKAGTAVAEVDFRYNDEPVETRKTTTHNIVIENEEWKIC
ncbi:MAG: hypothetical protein ACRCSF_02265 [Mycobacteriaceae bacterium]